MINVKGKNVLVMGLGSFGGGVGVTEWLVDEGADVTVTDLKTANDLKSSIDQLRVGGLRVNFILGKHDSDSIKKADLIVVNPAIKPDSPYLKIASKHRVTITTEMNLFLERCSAKVIGVTGTNGKGTVVKMVELALRAGLESRTTKVWVGGNIGVSLLNDLDRIKKNDVVVLELSSFQLAWLPIIKYSPHIAVVVNIAPDHLDWHKTMRAYIGAKENIVRYQTKTDIAVLNWTDANVRKLKTRGTVIKIKSAARIKLKVPGKHNKLNAAIARAVVRLFGVKALSINNQLSNFEGMPNALEYVRAAKGVKYYNDSEATTAQATIAALQSFNKKVILIIGGYDKKVSLWHLVSAIKQHTKQVYTIGATGPKIHELLKQNTVQSGTLEKAVGLIKKSAKKGDIVLLSPAAASYDQFKNLQERGETFKRLVLE